MADRERQGINGIVGPRQLARTKDGLHHLQHLGLGGASITSQREFDLCGRIFVDPRSRLRGEQDCYTACLADGHRRANILAEEQLLEDRDLRSKLCQEVTHLLREKTQAVRVRESRRRFQGTARDEGQPVCISTHGAIAGIREARIDP